MDPVGYGLVKGLFSKGEAQELIQQTPTLARAGTRRLLDFEWARRLALDLRMRSLAEELTNEHARPVRGILFDKVEGKNWTLGWHQDTKIPLREVINAPGYRGWSEKEGIVHALPPLEILEAGVALRLHLDPCHRTNGALQVIPGSHLEGLRENPTAEEIARAETLEAEVGDVIWMRPLVFHASAKAETPTHRRVIHLEYSAARLASGLRWAWEV